MAKRESFVLSDPPEDLGVKLYSFGDAESKKNLEKPWRSPWGIFLLTLLAFLVFWFLYSLIYAMTHDNAVLAIIAHLDGVFALIVCGVIIIATVFKLWAKLGRFALNHGLVKNRRAARNAKSGTELMEEAYDKMDEPTPVIEVYGSFVRVSDTKGRVKVYDREKIKEITAYKRSGVYRIALKSFFYDFAWIDCEFPKREIKKLKQLFGDVFTLDTSDDPVDKAVKQAYREAAKETFEVHAAGIVMGLICAAVGGGVIALHFLVSEKIPIVLGAFFIAGGVLAFFSAFESVPWVKVFIIPFIFGGIMLVVPPLFLVIIAEGNGVALPSTFQEFLTSFSGLYCGVLFLSAIGLLIIIIAFTGLIKYIKTGEY